MICLFLVWQGLLQVRLGVGQIEGWAQAWYHHRYRPLEVRDAQVLCQHHRRPRPRGFHQKFHHRNLPGRLWCLDHCFWWVQCRNFCRIETIDYFLRILFWRRPDLILCMRVQVDIRRIRIQLTEKYGSGSSWRKKTWILMKYYTHLTKNEMNFFFQLAS